MVFIRLLSSIFMLFLVHALQANSAIEITLINNSKYEFKRSETTTCYRCRLENDDTKIRPGEKVIIKGIITADVDFEGNMYFNNDQDRFHIMVNRLKLSGQPIFIMHSAKVKSRVDKESLRFNHDGVPTHLAYTAVTVYLE